MTTRDEYACDEYAREEFDATGNGPDAQRVAKWLGLQLADCKPDVAAIVRAAIAHDWFPKNEDVSAELTRTVDRLRERYVDERRGTFDYFELRDAVEVEA